MSSLKVLLINSNRFKDPYAVMPLGLCSVASSLEAAGHAVRVLDLCFAADPAAEIARAIAADRPRLVGVSIRNLDTCNGFQPHFLIDDVECDVITPLKACYDGPVVLGGAAVGINPEELLAHLDLEFAVRGDGEAAVLDLADYLSGKIADPAACRGLVRRQGGRITVANPPAFAGDLDRLPTPRINRWIEIGPYTEMGSPLTIQAKRGCPLNCSYCTYNQIEGLAWRLRSPAAIADEIAAYVRDTGCRRFEFVDSTFNVPLKHAKAILAELAGRGLGLLLSTMGLHPSAIDAELLGLMKRVGFVEISMGVESACPATLAGLGKNFTVEDIEKAGQLIREAGIACMWYVLLGAPGETLETARQSIATVRRLAATHDVLNVGIGIRAYRGSPLADGMLKRDPALAADNFLHPVAYLPDGVSLPELKYLAAKTAVRAHNVLMFDEGANIPLFVLKFVARKFPDQALWRAYTQTRLIERFNGAWLVRNLWFSLRSGLIRRRFAAQFAKSRNPGPTA
jgi:radical SAM superfamily enzyme YgiQ (UPF0313 family)